MCFPLELKPLGQNSSFKGLQVQRGIQKLKHLMDETRQNGSQGILQ